MFEKWYINLKSRYPSKETISSDIEYERVVLNKICCIAEDLKFYKVLDYESYCSV